MLASGHTAGQRSRFGAVCSAAGCTIAAGGFTLRVAAIFESRSTAGTTCATVRDRSYC
jgi:hypothetical protein